jgi:hypothetical protein
MSDHKPCPYPDGDDGLIEYEMWQRLKAEGLSSQNVNPATFGAREIQIQQWLLNHGFSRRVTRGTIWARSGAEADDITTLLAREWTASAPQPVVGIDSYPHGDDV